ncbi:hypothetical protein KAS08_03715 [Candidatus Pacearchaeota archaeon]|nr:hypothetical protein [Candidatus Pacearchaeota archaeon]
MVMVNEITNGAINGIIEVFIMTVLSGIIVCCGYEEEWTIVQQILAIGGVIFAVKVIIFLLPYTL